MAQELDLQLAAVQHLLHHEQSSSCTVAEAHKAHGSETGLSEQSDGVSGNGIGAHGGDPLGVHGGEHLARVRVEQEQLALRERSPSRIAGD